MNTSSTIISLTEDLVYKIEATFHGIVRDAFSNEGNLPSVYIKIPGVKNDSRCDAHLYLDGIKVLEFTVYTKALEDDYLTIDYIRVDGAMEDISPSTFVDETALSLASLYFASINSFLECAVISFLTKYVEEWKDLKFTIKDKHSLTAYLRFDVDDETYYITLGNFKATGYYVLSGQCIYNNKSRQTGVVSYNTQKMKSEMDILEITEYSNYIGELYDMLRILVQE